MVEKFDRFIIAVRNLEESMELFKRVLGVEFSENIVISNDPPTRTAIGLLGSEIGFELMQPTAPGPITKALEKRGEGIYAIAFKVLNLEKTISEMEEKGVKFATKTPIDFGGLREAFTHPGTTSGMMICLSEYTSQHGIITAMDYHRGKVVHRK